jgi:ferredoxin-type protein NapG
MDRRAFFNRGLRTVSEKAIEEIDARARHRAAHWIRPPFALDELEFLLACTRCRACIDACPHNVVFPLSARLGAHVAGTPALDLLNRGCRLCEDWPCVAACEPGALKRPHDVQDRPALPRIAAVTINTAACLPYTGPECGACASSCPVPGAMVWHHEKPHIDPEVCAGCAMCRDACIVEPKAVEIGSLYRKNRESRSA